LLNVKWKNKKIVFSIFVLVYYTTLMKSGKVLIVGRPNSGKSTLINNLVGQKISIVSIRPQTTRKVVEGYYRDERGEIIFLDTPGVFARIRDPFGKAASESLKNAFGDADLIIYLIDHTRPRGKEENLVLGMVRNTDLPKIVVVNKIDVKKPTSIHEYLFLKDEFPNWVEISALKSKHLKTLLAKIFELLPEGKPLFNEKVKNNLPFINTTPEEFVAEIIREKAFTELQEELPYSISVEVEKIQEKEKCFYIKASIISANKRYKPMIIGRSGQKIKKIGTLARKELELITGEKVYLELKVETL